MLSLELAALTLPLIIGAFSGAALVVLVAGLRLTVVAEHLAALTGLGQAVLGAVFLGAATSLSGIVTSVSAAAIGEAEIAYGNAVGGIAVQTTFLVIADMVYRGVNLEHAAASEQNLLQGVTLVGLLAIPIIGMAGPGWTVLGVDIMSLLIIAAYVFGLALVTAARKQPMWQPRWTSETAVEEEPGAKQPLGDMRGLWLRFVILAVIIGMAGYVIAETAVEIAERTGASRTVVGTLVTSVVTSTPELVVAVIAVRRGALTLAVGNILGGNTFDVLLLTFSDIAYRVGSIHKAVSSEQGLWLALNILLVAVMLLGLLRRQRHGLGNIGFEGLVVLGLYLAGSVIIAT